MATAPYTVLLLPKEVTDRLAGPSFESTRKCIEGHPFSVGRFGRDRALCHIRCQIRCAPAKHSAVVDTDHSSRRILVGQRPQTSCFPRGISCRVGWLLTMQGLESSRCSCTEGSVGIASHSPTRSTCMPDKILVTRADIRPELSVGAVCKVREGADHVCRGAQSFLWYSSG